MTRHYNTVVSNEVKVSLDPTPTTVALTFAAPPAGAGGTLILVLSIYFFANDQWSRLSPSEQYFQCSSYHPSGISMRTGNSNC